MSVRNGKGYIYLFTLIVIFGLAGTALGDALGLNFQALSFFSNGYSIGMTEPLVVDLKILTITFGINFNVNILSLIGMILAYIIYKKMW